MDFYAPLYTALKTLPPFVRLHTPGHKGRAGMFGAFDALDLTELSVTDDLYRPENLIAQAEQAATAYFGTAHTVFSAGGATLCIQTALSFFAGKKVLFDRNVHCSAVNAAALLDIDAGFLYNRFDGSFGIPLPPDAQRLKEVLRDGRYDAFFLTSPNYYGLRADLRRIYAVCKAAGVRLIVDNSHGSHLFLTDRENAAEKNSDFAISSTHKTLPALTGGAYLHENMGLDVAEIKRNMRCFGSTSPSFPVLASLDYARAWCQTQGERAFRETQEKLRTLCGLLSSRGFRCFAASDRLTLSSRKNGKNLATALEAAGIYPEMCDENNVLMLFSPFNVRGDYEAVERFFQTPFAEEKELSFQPFPVLERPWGLRRAMLAQKQELPAGQAVGKIAAQLVVPYPPGVPILLYGEKITAQAAAFLQRETDTVCVVKEG